jgi:hypothetical protein
MGSRAYTTSTSPRWTNDLLGPPELHHDGTPRRVVGFERRSGGRCHQTGHDADSYRHRRVGDAGQALLQRF